MIDWYLIRTKPSKERWVNDQLSEKLPEVFLPLLEDRIWRFGKKVQAIVPLFPSYLFAKFDLQVSYFDVKYMTGVAGLVSAGLDPLLVPAEIIDEIRARGNNGVVRIPEKQIQPGATISVIEGPFQGFQAIFERYLSGLERVAILLSTVEAKGMRITLPSSAITD